MGLYFVRIFLETKALHRPYRSFLDLTQWSLWRRTFPDSTISRSWKEKSCGPQRRRINSSRLRWIKMRIYPMKMGNKVDNHWFTVSKWTKKPIEPTDLFFSKKWGSNPIRRANFRHGPSGSPCGVTRGGGVKHHGMATGCQTCGDRKFCSFLLWIDQLWNHIWEPSIESSSTRSSPCSFRMF